MVKLRLSQKGRKNRKAYRVVANTKTASRDGGAIEYLGYSDPYKKVDSLAIDENAVYTWLKNGGQPSDTVKSMLKRVGIWKKWMLLKAGKDITNVALEAKPERKVRKKRRKAEAA
ncbi:MAG: 30S ribosomal protein S16 [Fibrobacteres bacterium]|nr:30S ribosomal protein S16 [Fibrobacterota bacterium]